MANLLEQINIEKKEYQISDLMDIKYGFGLPERDRLKGSIPVYASSGLVGFHNESKVKKPAIIIGRKGNVGSLSFSEKESYPIDTVFYVDEVFEDFDLKYVYYLLQRINLPRYGGDSAVPGLSRDTVYSIGVEVPNKDTQKKVSSLLSTYDEKIENNNKIIKNLETTAQTIFDEWFVNFKFPGYEKIKMVDSEMGEIPEGWKVGKIEDLIRIESGFPFSSKSFSDDGKYKLVTIRNVQDGEFVPDSENKILELPQKLPLHCKLKTGDILLSLTGNVGRVCLVIGVNYVLNQRVSVLIPKNINDIAFTYSLFRRKGFQNILINMAKGSAQPNLSPVDTKRLEIIIPSREILDKFSYVSTKFLNQVIELKNQNVSLKSQRDQLLSKLI